MKLWICISVALRDVLEVVGLSPAHRGYYRAVFENFEKQHGQGGIGPSELKALFETFDEKQEKGKTGIPARAPRSREHIER